MNRNRHKIKTGGQFAAILAAAVAVFYGGTILAGTTPASDGQMASITIRGMGVMPGANISLWSGSKQRLVAQSDAAGNFVFSNLLYSATTPLKFSLDIPPNTAGLVKNAPGNRLDISYDPRGSRTRIMGDIGKFGTMTFNVTGSERGARMQVAGDDGAVNLQTRTGLKLSSGESQLVANIINVGEVCCPRMVVPAPPITLSLSSLPMAASQPPAPSPSKPVAAPLRPNVPYIQPSKDEAAPQSTPEQNPAGDENKTKPAKKKIPYIIQGRVSFESRISFDTGFAAAASFPASAYDSTYVGGLKKIADSIRNTLLQHMESVGSMIDARNLMDSLRAMQVSAVDTLKDYAPSESICRFGTLSRSLVLSESSVEKNQQAFSKALMDRGNQQINTVYGNPISGISYMLQDFKKNYCEPVDNNGFLAEYCAAAVATSDLLYNRDIDFTRVFDVPLTVDADFTAATKTNDSQSLFALFDNLSLAPPYVSGDSNEFDPNKNMLKTQDIRAIEAARNVANNSFGALVAEKTRTNAASAGYMRSVLTQLGLSVADADKLIGVNPSYFAQMEIMTKKIFQDPTFYANLYDSPANIDRQRVAMKAVELQQGRDFLESLRRREMLLSVLLNMKLQTEAERSNQSGTINQKQK